MPSGIEYGQPAYWVVPFGMFKAVLSLPIYRMEKIRKFISRRRKLFILSSFLFLTACGNASGLTSNEKLDMQTLNAQAALGYPKAAYELGVQYYLGEITPKHDAKAYAWLSVAKSQGYPDAEAYLSKITKTMSQDQMAQGQDLSSTVQMAVRNDGGTLRDTERQTWANTIMNAVMQYQVDHGGRLPDTIANFTYPSDTDPALTDCSEIGKKCIVEICATTGSACAGLLDLHDALKPYLMTLPKDPAAEPPATGFGVVINKGSDGKTLIVFARYLETQPNIITAQRQL